MTEAGGAHRGAAGAVGARTLTITLPIPDPLLFINVRTRMHWRVERRHSKRQREDAMLAAYAAMSGTTGLRAVLFPEGKVRADVTVYRRQRQKVPDAGAQWEWLKPIWDGCQDAGVFADDKQIVHGQIEYRPADLDPRVVIVLTEVQP